MGKSYQRCPKCCKKSVAKWEAVKTEIDWRVREIQEDGNYRSVAICWRDEATARRIAALPRLENLVKKLEHENEKLRRDLHLVHKLLDLEKKRQREVSDAL